MTTHALDGEFFQSDALFTKVWISKIISMVYYRLLIALPIIWNNRLIIIL